MKRNERDLMPAVLADLRYISRLLATRASVTNLVPKRFKVFKMAAGGTCVALFVKFPALLFMVSRNAREPGVSDTENRAKREEDYPLFLLLFRLSFVKPYFNIFSFQFGPYEKPEMVISSLMVN